MLEEVIRVEEEATHPLVEEQVETEVPIIMVRLGTHQAAVAAVAKQIIIGIRFGMIGLDILRTLTLEALEALAE